MTKPLIIAGPGVFIYDACVFGDCWLSGAMLVVVLRSLVGQSVRRGIAMLSCSKTDCKFQKCEMQIKLSAVEESQKKLYLFVCVLTLGTAKTIFVITGIAGTFQSLLTY